MAILTCVQYNALAPQIKGPDFRDRQGRSDAQLAPTQRLSAVGAELGPSCDSNKAP